MQAASAFPHDVRVEENIFLPLPDGTRLAAKVWRPDAPGKFPVILEYLPYRKRDGTRARDNAMHAYLASHGYVCVRMDIRGTGDSEGILLNEYTEVEQQDGVAAIAWLAAQAWCDGQVAMIGISWGGFNGLQIAALQPPALKTVITVGSTDDRYATDIHWVGGCMSKDNFDWSATMFAMMDLPPDPVIVGDAWRDMWAVRMKANKPWMLEWLAHQRRDAYWQQGSVCEDFSRIQVPVYAVSGWADNYSESVPRLMAGLSVPRRGLIGPWAHSFPMDVTVGPAIGWLQEVLRWCDHWMKGLSTGIMDEPLLRVWMQESAPPQTCYRERPGRWVGEDTWPSPRIETHSLFTGAHGRLLDYLSDVSLTPLKSPLWVGLGAGEVGRYGDEADWATDQREDDGGSLVFTTDPLPDRVEIMGAPRLHLRFTSDAPQALIAVRLNDVAPDGASTRVTVGLLNLTHRDSHEAPTPLVPGQTYDTVVEFDDIAHAFPAGHRIAVSLSNTYWPIAWPSPTLTTLTIALGDTRMDLPVRSPNPRDAALRAFDAPAAAPHTPTIDHPVANPTRRTITRDLLSGDMVVNFPRWTSTVEMPDIAQTHTATGYARYTITDGNPLSACIDTHYNVQIQRPDATCGHESTGRMTCDATHFRVEVSLSVTENGAQIFHRTWDERVARDMV
jgi:uncharacterized protein